MTPPPPAPATYSEPDLRFVADGPVFPARLDAMGKAQIRWSLRDRSAHDRACRILNVLVAALGLILVAPLLLVIAVAVKLSSPGPIIYRQPRVGLDRRRRVGLDRRRRASTVQGKRSRRSEDRGGRIFTIYKFRTMRADLPTPQVWASRTDARVTAVGRVLRATRLDELPQFYNVLIGDMNIVGPRPEQPEIFRDLSDKIVNYRERQRVLPGITGLAQVNQGYDATLDDVRRKVALDLEYIERRSAAEDLLIMAKTMPVMVFQKVWM